MRFDELRREALGPLAEETPEPENLQRQLLAQLEFSVKAAEYFYPRRKSAPYWCAEDFILKHGQTFRRAAMPPPVLPIPRACFQQSYELCTKKRSRWIYCEGFALSELGLVVHHAWVTPRERPGEAYDLAWSEERHRNPAYMGCAFRPEFVRDTYKSSGKLNELSVLYAWWAGFPLLTGAVEIEDVIWKP
jgi:hypothetical protein